jgi:hypothetical protein
MKYIWNKAAQNLDTPVSLCIAGWETLSFPEGRNLCKASETATTRQPTHTATSNFPWQVIKISEAST